MHKKIILTGFASALLLLSSCSSKMGALSSDFFTVTPNPLETAGGEVSATIDGKFPEKYMKRKAVVTVTPELRYAGGQVCKGQPATFQGEKVLGNDQTISYRLGGNYSMKTTFPYVDDMHVSELYLTFDASKGKKHYNVPAVKVADGVIATSELYRKTLTSDGAVMALDSFQRITNHKQEANIRFLVNQAKLRKSELKNNSVKEFVRLLQDINNDTLTRREVKNVEIAAYASPEGGFDFNDKLAGKRQDVSQDYVKQQMKKAKVNADVMGHYTAQDWDGFQQLVKASNLQDKDVILRVLSMYKDPEEREKQIRNISQAFRELADGILPELRRSRMTINYEVVGRSDDEINQQYAADASKLSLEELLYCAALQKDNAAKKNVYTTATRQYPNDYRAYSNLAALELNAGNEAAANNYMQKAVNASAKAPEVYANKALVALQKGDKQLAEQELAKATDANDYNQALGLLNIAKGNYAQAVSAFGNKATNSAALAKILARDYEGALATLNKVENPDAMTTYLHAIVAARRDNSYAAGSYLKEALQKDPSLKAYADSDLELGLLKK